MMKRNPKHRFIGANIKGTPKMQDASVRHDLKKIRRNASVFVAQEFKWPSYWRVADSVLKAWKSAPKNFLTEALSAQPVFWDPKKWEVLDVRTTRIHPETAGVSLARYGRAALLRCRKTGRTCWFFTTHLIVSGDMRHDPALRRGLLDSGIGNMAHFIAHLKRVLPAPIIGQLDANIGRGSAAMVGFQTTLKGLGARFVGEQHVEFLFVIDGEDTKVRVVNGWVIPAKRLRTDHEARGLTFQLVSKR